MNYTILEFFIKATQIRLAEFADILLREFIINFIPAKLTSTRAVIAVNYQRCCTLVKKGHRVGVILKFGEDLAVDLRLAADGLGRGHVIMHIVVIGESYVTLRISAMRPSLKTLPRRRARPSDCISKKCTADCAVVARDQL